MTLMMYRGFPQDANQPQTASGPQDLIYRGFRHNGQPEAQVRLRGNVPMCYRGQWHRDAISPAAKRGVTDEGAMAWDGVSGAA